ncbi:MAG: AAA family ATPase [Sorangiineae bacterium PRO1]|nr:AAA family ATPase [Sorangiineae bacterium PRO1]
MAPTIAFNDLCAARAELREAVANHRDSILWFKHPEQPWFVVEQHRRGEEHAESPAAKIRHLSSTATCFESLNDPLAPATPDQAREDASAIVSFAEQALSNPDDATWSSELAAGIYCRVRTLAPILALAPTEAVARHREAVKRLTATVWDQVEPGESERQGVAEAPRSGTPSRQRYPANAFHTYWAIRILEEWEGRHRQALGRVGKIIRTKRRVAELWARQTLATQTALIRFDADRVDAHQLAWALSTEFLGSQQAPVTASTPHLELYQAALDAYFSAQLPSGGWPLYEPLFHYPAAGNAYCYTFETLAALVKPALHFTGGQVLRTLLKPYLPELLSAARFAERTRIDLGDGASGWCSGHHPHRDSAEAWATASVFSYLQALRCLVGYWTAEEALVRRGGRRPKVVGTSAEERLGERGDLWPDDNGWSAGRQLAAMFMHPIKARVGQREWIDPDRPLIEPVGPEGPDQARSAILFGPPGTGKTKLVESLAGSVNWHFVEVLSSDFLSDGMDKVPAKADEIFEQLMELDHCVILFDEIDELVRNRDEEADPFGRFLTTSMLPKLAKLWDQRRVLFFVATNDVDAADPAIKRTQRFDARLFVTPPAFHVKKRLLTRSLKDQGRRYPAALTEERVTKSLERGYQDSDSFGVFALLRFDQMAELARLMTQEAGDAEAIPAAAAKAALGRMGTQLAAIEWQHAELDPYTLYRHHRQNESFDERMMRVARMPPGAQLPAGVEALSAEPTGGAYGKVVLLDRPDLTPDGDWKLKFGTTQRTDRRRLDFGDN